MAKAAGQDRYDCLRAHDAVRGRTPNSVAKEGGFQNSTERRAWRQCSGAHSFALSRPCSPTGSAVEYGGSPSSHTPCSSKNRLMGPQPSTGGRSMMPCTPLFCSWGCRGLGTVGALVLCAALLAAGDVGQWEVSPLATNVVGLQRVWDSGGQGCP